MIQRILPVLALVFSFSVTPLNAFAESQPDAAAFSKAIGVKRLELASLLIKALDTGLVCDTDAYPSEIIRTVTSATAFLDPADIKAWVSTIPSDSKILADFAFRERTTSDKPWGSTVTKADLQKKLLGAKFHRLGAGAYGSTLNVTLLAGGVAAIRELEELEAEPYVRWVDRAGTWDVEVVDVRFGQEITVKIGADVYGIEWQANEVWLVPSKLPEYEKQQNTLSSSDSYCEA